MRLADQVAVVTGASSGIGRAVSMALVGEGARVAMVARSERLADAGAEVAAAGGQVLEVTADVSDATDVERMTNEVLDWQDRIDILVNNAGVGKYGPLESLTVEDYDWMMNTNMRSSFLCTHALLPTMLEAGSGHVVFLASVAGLKGLPNETVYCASKFAQVGFAQALDYETRGRGVKVSVVAPGGVHTDFAIGTGRTEGDPVLEQMLDAGDVAAAVLFAVTQPPKSRTFLIGMRPMSEPL